MIWKRHVRHRIAPFADGAMSASERTRFQAHVSACDSCRVALESYHSVASLLQQMATVEAPAGVWHSIEAALDEPGRKRSSAPAWFHKPSWALAAAMLVVASAATGWWFRSRPAAWDVVRLDRHLAPRVADGQWLETTPASTAAIRIGEIGRVDLAPGTRLQLISARPNEHRLNLARGRISVQIIAPPRVFFVETPTSTVVDLGCAYTMDVDATGGGILRVTQGWAALEWTDRQSLVPAGASATTRPSLGPGTPSFDDATDEFKRALEAFDFSADKDANLVIVLAEARARDTLTLWHLMSRVQPHQRASVFDRLVSLTPLPAGVNREQALNLDVDTMRRWREELAWTW
jgi:anti-sigma factor RsiW